MHVLIRYAVRPEALAEHLRLANEVYADLNRLALPHVEYATYLLEDQTTFVEIFYSGTGAGALAASPAFARFRSTLESRIDAAPEVTDLRPVGIYSPPAAAGPAAPGVPAEVRP